MMANEAPETKKKKDNCANWANKTVGRLARHNSTDIMTRRTENDPKDPTRWEEGGPGRVRTAGAMRLCHPSDVIFGRNLHGKRKLYGRSPRFRCKMFCPSGRWLREKLQREPHPLMAQVEER